MKKRVPLLFILIYFLSCTTTQDVYETNILEINGKTEKVTYVVDRIYETSNVTIGPNPGPFIKFTITPQYTSYNKIELFIHSEILKRANIYNIENEDIYIIIDDNQTWLLGDLIVDENDNKISLTFDFDFTNLEGHINGIIEFNDDLLPFHVLPGNDHTNKVTEIQNTNNTALFNYTTLQNGKVVIKDAKFTNSFDNILVAGLFAGDVDFDILNNSGKKRSSNQKVFLANYTPDYELRWVKIIDGYPEAGLTFNSIRILNENEIVIAGNIRNNADINPTHSINAYKSFGGPESKYSDCFITSYNFNNQFWTYTYGGDTKDVFTDLIMLEDGSIVATSYTSNSTGKVYFRNSNLETISKPIMGNQNGVILKLSNDGIYEWARTINGNKWVWPREVKESSNNSIEVFGDVLGALDINPSNEIELITPEVIPPNNGQTPFSFRVNLDGNVITKPKFLYPDTSGTDMRYKGYISSGNDNSLLISKQRDSAQQLDDTIIESNYSDWRWRQSADDIRGMELDVFLNISSYDKNRKQESKSILINGDYKDGFFHNGKYWIIGIIGENYSINDDIPSLTVGSYKVNNHSTENMIYLIELDTNLNIANWFNIPLNQRYAEIENIKLIHNESHIIIIGTVSNMRMQNSYKDDGFQQDYFFAKIPLD